MMRTRQLILTGHGFSTAWLESTKEQHTQVFVNPHTGKILDDRIWEKSLIGLTFSLHYELLAGLTGQTIIGIEAVLTQVASYAIAPELGVELLVIVHDKVCVCA